MGLTLDSSIVIAAERQQKTPGGLLAAIRTAAGNQPVAISSIALTELAHAIYRAKSPAMRAERENFIYDLLTDIEVLSYTKSTAMLAGKLDGEQAARGITIPSIDLLIGATALEFGYAIVTSNVRHFRLIPGLQIIAM